MPLNINFLQILLHALNFLILAGGLWLLLYKPICRFLEERKSYFEKTQKELEEKREATEALKPEYELKLKESREEINELRIKTEKETADIARATIERAKEEAQKIVLAAETEAEKRKEHILDAAQVEIGELVLSAAQKLLNDTVSPERDAVLYDEFIRLADKTVKDKRASK